MGNTTQKQHNYVNPHDKVFQQPLKAIDNPVNLNGVTSTTTHDGTHYFDNHPDSDDRSCFEPMVQPADNYYKPPTSSFKGIHYFDRQQ